MSGIDTAMPDVRNKWSYHAEWNQNDRFWQEDFQQLADCGFDLLRWQMPWSLVEASPGEYCWDLIDPKVELATKLGLEIFYPIVHFNYPRWLADRGAVHGVLAEELADRLAEYTEQILSRYNFRFVIPIVEIDMEAFMRGRVGNWQPHLKGRNAYREIHSNLLSAFKASATVARSHGATIFCSEPASSIDTVVALKDHIDIAGIDLYPHMHKKWSVVGYFRKWWKAVGHPLCISEFGTPETYNPAKKIDECHRFVTAGVDANRVAQARLLKKSLQQAEREGIPIPYGGWYPGTGNIGWGQALTQERTGLDCDRAGLVDLTRQPDGTLKRVLCSELVQEVLGLGTTGSASRYREPVSTQTTSVSIPVPAVEQPASSLQ